tara:strand:+ start:1023 stop:1886 length:864 start_codon:yes stop_codon:yes gene_type:complete
MHTIEDLNHEARELLNGAIDLHAHAAPDPFAERKMDARELVAAASEAGMAGVVLKSHEYPTEPLAWALNSEFDAIKVHGAIALDHGVGGLNPDALETALRIGTRVVWMPTFDSVWSRDTFGRFNSKGSPITILNETGALKPVIHELLDLISDHSALLCTGHLSPAETSLLVETARQRDIRTIVTHATAFGIPLEVQQRAAELGAFVEQCGNVLFRNDPEKPTQAIVDEVAAIGAEHIVLSTDLGQVDNPPPPFGFGLWIQCFLDSGFSNAEVLRMVQQNPKHALNEA